MKKEKTVAYVTLTIFILTLIPLIVIGFFNHPMGDDYHYGANAYQIWIGKGGLLAVLTEAVKGVVRQYGIWQGTYTAMFFMYLPPQVFGRQMYHLVTLCILLLLTAGIFLLARELIQKSLGMSKYAWLSVASVTAFAGIQNNIFAQESFYWYNGSMYYTGFMAVTLILSALFVRTLREEDFRFLPILVVGGLFIAGGNYTSLLPTMIAVFLMGIIYVIKRKKRKMVVCASFFLSLVTGFLISALAPGNQVRQAESMKSSAFWAISRSIKFGIGFIPAWLGGILILCLLAITPVIWKGLRDSRFRFPHPYAVIPLVYLIYCSALCPSLYAQSTIGQARCDAVYFYGFVFNVVFAWIYFLGWLHGEVSGKADQKKKAYKGVSIAVAAVMVVIAVFQMVRLNELTAINVRRAMVSLCSGQASQYEREYRQRLELLENPKLKDVTFQAYSSPPEIMFVGDYAEDAQYNETIARFYNKDSVRVEKRGE